MILAIVTGTILQASSLPYPTWKERNQPDAALLPSCKLGTDAAHIETMRGLPPAALTELKRLFETDGISDVGGPFNSTDVIHDKTPRRRFIRAYHVQTELVVWYETGGFVSGPRTVLLTQKSWKNAKTANFRTVPNTFLTGNLCAATRALLDGVLVASP